MSEIETQLDGPNDRYSPTDLGTWSSVSDVDAFMNRFNHDNNYSDGGTKLGLGDYVTIKDGTYNLTWVIAGFDMEHNRTAADGTVYDNGYGICMIPKSLNGTAAWDSRDTYEGGYMSSAIHMYDLPYIANILKNVVGSHMVNRNVLLSSSVTSGGTPNAYTWTTADTTLMSAAQVKIGYTESIPYNTKYDIGESNYLLPLFAIENCATNKFYWLRNLAFKNSVHCYACGIETAPRGNISKDQFITMSLGVRQLMYIR